ncbi:MAG: phage major capsid protein [Sphingomonadales bacterium]|nr:phage major capsid protein [Sphingomonadales bacterium]
MADGDLKTLIAEGNKVIEALRAEVTDMKNADVLHKDKIGKMEKDLADTLAAKQAAEMEMKAIAKRLEEVETKANRPAAGHETKAADDYKAAFIDFARKGMTGKIADQLEELAKKATDVQVATPASGGYALPKQIAAEIARVADDISPIRSIARVVQTGTTDYHELVIIGGMGYEWVGETSDRTQTDTPSFADVVPTFGEISAKPEATRASIADLFFDVEGLLINEGSRRFAYGEGVAFVSGNGINKPTGFLNGTPVSTADASRAFGTLQYIPTGAAADFAATNAFDVFKDTMFTLKAGYRGNGTWVMNSLTMAQIAKFKDANGEYLLQPAIVNGEPYMISGKPVVIAEDMPGIGANAFPIAFGDFKQGYLIADIPGMWMVRDELTKTGWVRFPMARRVGGKIKDSNAIKLIKIAAA